jgi:hypothetical protein
LALITGPLKVPLEAVSKKSKNSGFLSGRFCEISIRKPDLAFNLDNFYPETDMAYKKIK